MLLKKRQIKEQNLKPWAFECIYTKLYGPVKVTMQLGDIACEVRRLVTNNILARRVLPYCVVVLKHCNGGYVCFYFPYFLCTLLLYFYCQSVIIIKCTKHDNCLISDNTSVKMAWILFRFQLKTSCNINNIVIFYLVWKYILIPKTCPLTGIELCYIHNWLHIC